MFYNIHTHYNIDIKSEIINFCVSTMNFVKNSQKFSAGIHPWHIGQLNEKILFEELFYFLSSPNCIALGEIGLDKICSIDFDKQIYFFEKQILIANVRKLPVIIHCVKSYNEVLNFRKKYTDNIWIIHDFSGSLNLAKDLINNNFYISLGNNFMRDNSKIGSFLSLLPIDRFFFETDNKLFDIQSVYQKASENLGIKITELEKIIEQNIQKVFRWI